MDALPVATIIIGRTGGLVISVRVREQVLPRLIMTVSPTCLNQKVASRSLNGRQVMT